MRVAAARRASARIGSASAGSFSSPLARVMKAPARSSRGKALVPQDGGRHLWSGMIQIWKMRVGSSSRLYSLWRMPVRSEEHTSELQSRENLVCRLLLEKKKRQANVCIGI